MYKTFSWLTDLGARSEARLAQSTRIEWPDDRYEHDFIGFCRDVLDTELWEEQQRLGVECSKENSRVSAVGGQKWGKTRFAACFALWAWATFDPVRVFLFAPKIEHTEEIGLWPEIKTLFKNSGRCAKCKVKVHAKCDHGSGVWKCRPVEPCPRCSPLGPPELINSDVTKGLKSIDERREIKGYTSVNLDALGGLSGWNQVFIFDEAGGIRQEFFDAMLGNTAGGVRWLQLGNPLHNTGHFYDSHHSKKHLFSYLAQVDSSQTPNITLGYRAFPGLPLQHWVDLCAEAWGPESTLFLQRVKGQFPKWEDGQLLSVDQIQLAFDGWAKRELIGKRLQIGVDVAGLGTDPAVIAPRRGYKVAELKELARCTATQLAEACYDIGVTYREGFEHEQKPLLVFDAMGKEGADFKDAIKDYDWFFDIVPIYGTKEARDRKRFYMLRDELAHDFADLVKRGRAFFPPGDKLLGELLKLVATNVSKTDTRKRTPTNDETRKFLKRSPNHRDACVLAFAFVRGSASDAKAGDKSDAKPASPGARPRAPNRSDESDGPADVYGDADRAARCAYGDR